MSGPLVAWGLDVSTKAVSLAILTDGERPVSCHTITFPAGMKGATRLRVTHQTVRPFLGRLIRSTRTPDAVFVEQPFGKHVAPQSQWTLGVILLALAETTEVPILTIPVPQWKSMSVGNGNATKTDVMAWAQAHGYTGSIQDEADAFGVATAGLYVLRRELPEAA